MLVSSGLKMYPVGTTRPTSDFEHPNRSSPQSTPTDGQRSGLLTTRDSFRPSPGELQCKLNLTGGNGGLIDEPSAGHGVCVCVKQSIVGVGRCKIRVIEQVVGLYAKLEVGPFRDLADRERLVDREIQVNDSWARQLVAPGIPHTILTGPGYWHGRDRGIRRWVARGHERGAQRRGRSRRERHRETI